jgi:hypothetical protein
LMYFEEENLSLTQRLDKRGRFETGSKIKAIFVNYAGYLWRTLWMDRDLRQVDNIE